MKKACMLAFTDRGRELAGRIACGLENEYSFKFYDGAETTAREFVAAEFGNADEFIFVGAVGIAVRLIAPHIKSKDVDPAVIAVDERGRFVIPVLSGHLGGANRGAAEIAVVTGGQAVITTATDINGKFAVDLWTSAEGCVIDDISMIKVISGEILKGNQVGFDAGDFETEGDLPKELTTDRAEAGIAVAFSNGKKPFEKTLTAIPRIVTLGVGCRRDTDSGEFEEKVLEILRERGVSIKAVRLVASVDLKKDEKCILDFCGKYGLEFVTYSPEELMAVPGEFASSDFVLKTTGADNICERSAAASGGRIIINKTAAGGVTVAAAAEDWKCRF